MSRETAYRLRRKPGAGSFAHAWDVAVGRVPPKRKVTPEELHQRTFFGLLKPLIYRGRYVSTVRKADNSAVLRYLAQIDRNRSVHDPSGLEARGFTPRFR